MSGNNDLINEYTATLAFLEDLKNHYSKYGQGLIDKVISCFVNFNADSNRYVDLVNVINKRQLDLHEWESYGNRMTEKEREDWERIKKQCLTFANHEDHEANFINDSDHDSDQPNIQSDQEFLRNLSLEDSNSKWVVKLIYPLIPNGVMAVKNAFYMLNVCDANIKETIKDEEINLIYNARRAAINEMITKCENFIESKKGDEQNTPASESEKFYYTELESHPVQYQIKCGNESVKIVHSRNEVELLVVLLNKVIK